MLLINLFGGPGSGKSTTAAGLFYFLKKMGINAEYVTEFAKDLVYQNNLTELGDQFNIFSQQNNKLKILSGVDVVITDSPLIFSALYPNKHYPISEMEKKEIEAFETVVVSHFKRYKSINIFLNRAHDYVPHGRTQDEAGAIRLSQEIKNFLNRHSVSFEEITTGDNTVGDIFAILERSILSENIKVSTNAVSILESHSLNSEVIAALHNNKKNKI